MSPDVPSSRPQRDAIETITIDSIPELQTILSDIPKIVSVGRPFHLPRARYRLAIYLLLFTFGVLAGIGLLIVSGDLTPKEAKDILPLVLTPLFTLLGTAIAFYFSQGDPQRPDHGDG